MQQYWINQGGVQAGPVTIDELEKMKVGPEAYVWRSGLDDWVKITELPELAAVVAPVSAPEPPAIEPEAAAAEPEPEAAPEPEPESVSEPEPEPEQPEAPELPDQQLPPPLPQPVSASGESRPDDGQPAPKCPPTNVAWGIVAVLLCQPLGILAIVLGVMVKTKYDAGEYDRALSLSEWSAWSCIAAITLGVGFGWVGALVSLLL